MNRERARHGLSPYLLDENMSNGTPGCIGAIGHAKSEASQGTIGHWDFPGDVCGYGTIYTQAGENVGVSATGSVNSDLDSIEQQMEGEPWSPGCSGNHHCNIDSSSYTHVGIGIVEGQLTFYNKELMIFTTLPASYLSVELAG